MAGDASSFPLPKIIGGLREWQASCALASSAPAAGAGTTSRPSPGWRASGSRASQAAIRRARGWPARDCLVTADWHAILDRSRIDAAIVATPPALHAEMDGRGGGGGLPVLVEKPLTLDLEEAVALRGLVAAHGRLRHGRSHAPLPPRLSRAQARRPALRPRSRDRLPLRKLRAVPRRYPRAVGLGRPRPGALPRFPGRIPGDPRGEVPGAPPGARGVGRGPGAARHLSSRRIGGPQVRQLAGQGTPDGRLSRAGGARL